MRTFNSLLSISVMLVGWVCASSADAALVFRITEPPPNTGVNVGSISLSDGNLTKSVTVGVALNTTESGGFWLNSFAFSGEVKRWRSRKI